MGIREGRRAHAILDRAKFAGFAHDFEALAVGPFNKPRLRGPQISYFDVRDRASL